MPSKYRKWKLLERVSSSYNSAGKLFSKFIAPYILPALIVYGLIKLFSIQFNRNVFMFLGSTLLWAAYVLVAIFLAIRIKGQADMQKTQQKLLQLSGRRVASEIEAFTQEVLPIVFDVTVKLGFAVGLLYLHLLNEKRKWVAYSDKLTVILLIIVSVLLMLIYFSIAFYVSKIDVEVVKNSSKEEAKKKNTEEKVQEEKQAPAQVKPQTSGYHPYFDPKLEGSINYGLTPNDANWEDFATSPFNFHPSNPNRNPNAIVSKHMQNFMSKYYNSEVRGLSEELLKPKEESHKEPEKEVKTLIIVPKEEETSEKKVGEQPNRFSENLNIDKSHLQKVLEQRKTS